MNPDPWHISPVSGGSTRTNSKSTETVDQEQHEFSAAALHSQGAKALKPAGLSGRPFHHAAAMAIFPKASTCWHHSTLKAFSPAIPSCGGMARIPTKASIAGTIPEAYFSPAIPSCGGYGQIPKASCWHHSTKLSFHHGYGHVPKSIYIAGTIRSNFQPGHSIMWRLWPFPKAAIAGTSPLELSFACIAQQAVHATSSSNPNSPGGHRSLADLTSCSSPHGPAAPYGARSAA